MIFSIAPAKINLFLHITGKRDDGYHLINSIFIFSEFGDKIQISDAKNTQNLPKSQSLKDTLSISGSFSDQIENNNKNLILQTVNIIKEKYNIHEYVHIDLEKNIPVGAGIGGGSSDAATTGKLLRDLWNLNITDNELASLLLPLGADIAACVHSKLSYVEGIGEKIKCLKLNQPLSILLVNPMINISTADIFTMGIKEYSENIKINTIPRISEDLILWLASKNNDLEANAALLFPEIRNITKNISNLKGCRLARMSGSGSTCFGVFNNIEEAEIAAKDIKKIYPDFWIIASECR